MLSQYINRESKPIFSLSVKTGLLLAIVYLISGKLSLMLALPPGYASPIFPPAGIAIAAALIAGRKTFLWILLGSLSLNLWISYSATQTINTQGLVIGIIIAIASLLQAAAGGRLLRKVIGYPCALDNHRDILRFLLLSPLICLISATISVSALLTLDIIKPDSFISNWASWWVGDTLGLMVMLPLIMTFFGSPKELWRSRRTTVAIPMLAIFLFFIAAFIKVNQFEYSQSLADFRQYSLQTSIQLQSKLDEQESLLEQMAGYFLHDDNSKPSRAEFQRFVKKSLQRFPMIQALSWAPRISGEQRSAFEIAQRKDFPRFTIRERDKSGQLQPAAAHNFYYPVTYLEPLAGNEVAMGFDLASNQLRQEAINKTKETTKVAISAPITLVQDSQNQVGVLLILAIDPHYNEYEVVNSVLRMSDFINKLLPELQPLIYTRLYDLDAQSALYDNFESQSAPVFYTKTFNFGSRHYRLETTPTPAYFKQHNGWQSWGVLAIGMIGTSLLGSLLLIGTGYTARVKNQVEERTHELESSQETAVKALDDLQYQKFILDQLADVTVTDLHGTITYANKKFCEISGYEEQELLGKNHNIVNSGVHSEQFFRDIYKTIQSGQVWKGEVCNRAKNGKFYWETTTIVPYLDGAGKPENYIAMRTDITDRIEMEEAMRESEYRWKFALEGAGDGVWDWDIAHSSVFFSKRWKEMLGFTNEEVGDSVSEWQKRIHPEDKAKTMAVLHDYLDGKTTTYVSEYRVKCKDGGWKWILDRGMVVSRDTNATPLRIIGTYTDITERKHNEQLVQHMAHYDLLTGLPNRALFSDRLNLAFAAAKRASVLLAVMFIDLDKFKPINDQFGHHMGDCLLQEVAKRIQHSLRESDTVGRIGGDEFVVLLPNIKSEQDAIDVAEKIRTALNQSFSLAKQALNISSSIGVAIFPQHGGDEMQLMKNADIAMYRAKESGRDSVRLYSFAMQNEKNND
ncbi:MAG: diguanylate cyclase (GGDEF)-like protein/PAS domain S-box-containing protein [Psychromonas sp.]|uniref:diguanylate cyclase domain-containing protein n=1 Tax=Psychromonas sp. TaxID=1884585 RepID=UPI0039E57DA6